MELECRRVQEVEDKKQGCMFASFRKVRSKCQEGIGLKASTSCRALEIGLRNFATLAKLEGGLQNLRKCWGRCKLMFHSGFDQHSFPCFRNIATSCK